jgi:hypothetical protein
MPRIAWLVIGGLWLILVGLGLYSLRISSDAVCHAPTEDSRIVDCDYRNGGWHKR